MTRAPRPTLASLTLTVLLLAFAITTVASSDAHADPKVLKLATLAPKGSDWETAFRRADKKIREKTANGVELRIYAGGVMGDEQAMVRKMRTGQIDAGAVTGVGLGEINQELLVMQLPFLFRNYTELDYVRDHMSGTLAKLLEDKGFVLLTWGDVGFQYLFSSSPITSLADARAAKMWVWDADPISKKVMELGKINATPLGVPDVLPGLTTGLVNAFLNSPYGAVALQWSTKAKYIMDVKLAFVTGGVVISKASWNALTDAERAAVRDAFKEEGIQLLADIRKANDAAQKRLLTKDGYKASPVTDISDWLKLGDDVRAALTGTLFPKALIDELLGHLKQAH